LHEAPHFVDAQLGLYLPNRFILGVEIAVGVAPGAFVGGCQGFRSEHRSRFIVCVAERGSVFVIDKSI
jgi:hypothetical protein